MSDPMQFPSIDVSQLYAPQSYGAVPPPNVAQFTADQTATAPQTNGLEQALGMAAPAQQPQAPITQNPLFQAMSQKPPEQQAQDVVRQSLLQRLQPMNLGQALSKTGGALLNIAGGGAPVDLQQQQLQTQVGAADALYKFAQQGNEQAQSLVSMAKAMLPNGTPQQMGLLLQTLHEQHADTNLSDASKAMASIVASNPQAFQIKDLERERLAEQTRHDQAEEGIMGQRMNLQYGNSGSAAGQPLDYTKTGPDFITQLDPQRASLVKAVGDHSMSMMQALGGRASLQQKQAFQADVMAYNPKYNAANFSNIQVLDKAPNQAGAILASNGVAAGHLALLKDLYDAQRNGDVQLMNRAANALATATGNPATTDVNLAKQYVFDEVQKSVLGAAGGQQERENANAALASFSSPEQVGSGINTLQHLMQQQRLGQARRYLANGATLDHVNQFLPENMALKDIDLQALAGGPLPADISSPGATPITATSADGKTKLVLQNGQWVKQ